PRSRHRERPRLRDRHRTRGQGPARPPSRRRDPYDLAGTRLWRVELPPLGLAAALPPLVRVRVRAPHAARRLLAEAVAVVEGRQLMAKVLVSGSAGFIGGYVVEELLRRGHSVVGIDNHSKYGPVRKSYDDDPNYRLVEGDAQDVGLMTELLSDCDHFIAGA